MFNNTYDNDDQLTGGLGVYLNIKYPNFDKILHDLNLYRFVICKNNNNINKTIIIPNESNSSKIVKELNINNIYRINQIETLYKSYIIFDSLSNNIEWQKGAKDINGKYYSGNYNNNVVKLNNNIELKFDREFKLLHNDTQKITLYTLEKGNWENIQDTKDSSIQSTSTKQTKQSTIKIPTKLTYKQPNNILKNIFENTNSLYDIIPSKPQEVYGGYPYELKTDESSSKKVSIKLQNLLRDSIIDEILDDNKKILMGKKLGDILNINLMNKKIEQNYNKMTENLNIKTSIDKFQPQNEVGSIQHYIWLDVYCCIAQYLCTIMEKKIDNKHITYMDDFIKFALFCTKLDPAINVIHAIRLTEDNDYILSFELLKELSDKTKFSYMSFKSRDVSSEYKKWKEKVMDIAYNLTKCDYFKESNKIKTQLFDTIFKESSKILTQYNNRNILELIKQTYDLLINKSELFNHTLVNKYAKKYKLSSDILHFIINYHSTLCLIECESEYNKILRQSNMENYELKYRLNTFEKLIMGNRLGTFFYDSIMSDECILTNFISFIFSSSFFDLDFITEQNNDMRKYDTQTLAKIKQMVPTENVHKIRCCYLMGKKCIQQKNDDLLVV